MLNGKIHGGRLAALLLFSSLLAGLVLPSRAMTDRPVPVGASGLPYVAHLSRLTGEAGGSDVKEESVKLADTGAPGDTRKVPALFRRLPSPSATPAPMPGADGAAEPGRMPDAGGTPMPSEEPPVPDANLQSGQAAEPAKDAGGLPPRRERVEFRKKLEASNRLVLDIAAVKQQVREQASPVKKAVQALGERRSRLTGEQLVVLKEWTERIRAQREKVVTQEKAVHEARLALRAARLDGRLADATRAADALIAAQQTLLESLRTSASAAERLLETARKTGR